MNGSTLFQRCLVTGASGFIGSILSRTLKENGCFVKALLRNQNFTKENFSKEKQHSCFWDEVSYFDFEEINADLSKNVKLDNIDTVFHLAGIAHSKNKNISKAKYWQVNVHAAVSLLKLASQAGVKRFIYFSSVKAGDAERKGIETEEREIDAEKKSIDTKEKGIATAEYDSYAASKRVAEQELLTLGRSLGIHVSIIRPALVYGKGVKGNLAMMISGIKKGWFVNLPQTKNQRSLVSIEDLIDASLCIANTEKSNGKIYTITDGKPYSTHDLLAAIRKALGKSPMLFTIPTFVLNSAARLCDALQCILKKEFPFNSDVLEKLLGSAYYSNQDIQTDLNWHPKFTFYDKITEIVAEN